MVYAGKSYSAPQMGRMVKLKKPSYKKAIITMKEDFVFPALPDLSAEGGIQMMPEKTDTPVGRNSHSKFPRPKGPKEAKEI